MGTVVAVGALGGSGTRAVAQILMESGVYMGDDLNHAFDNLIFTRLFKNPLWYSNASKAKIRRRVQVFREYMERERISFSSAIELALSSITNPLFRAHKRIFKNIARKIVKTPADRSVWGWKEPNTQIYINEIKDVIPEIKYIHVVRHGLDMAFSNNKQQLENWGQRYGLDLNGSESEDELAYKQLSYWVGSTRNALRKGAAMGSNFLLVNHSALCEEPERQIQRLVQFSELNVSSRKVLDLCRIPKVPDSLGRYRSRDLGIFDQWQIDFVKELGFKI